MLNLPILNAIQISIDPDGRFCLNDLHKASGGEQRHKPANWLQLGKTQELIEALAEMGTEFTAGNPALEQIQPLNIVNGGENPGSYAVKDLVYDYAMWISPRFKVQVIRTFDGVISKALDAANTWEQQRQGSKKIRAAFTETLKEHGVAGFGFAQCTNGIYRPLFGGTAKQLKAKKGLKSKDLLRDAMSVEELAFTTVAEVVASQRMDLHEDQGNSPCYNTCKSSGQDVRGLLVKNLD